MRITRESDKSAQKKDRQNRIRNRRPLSLEPEFLPVHQ